MASSNSKSAARPKARAAQPLGGPLDDLALIETKPLSASVEDANLPFADSVGYQLRMTHRALQRYLQAMIQPHGVTLGMWYFLRVLWDEDGMTQRELSRRIGTSEPTTLNAIAAMERIGLVTRRRDKDDGRKLNVLLTDKGRDLKAVLLPSAIHVVETATIGLSDEQRTALLSGLAVIQRNLDGAMAGPDATDFDV
jgi:MarR family transcriptional regulator, organic hydroperoxide resistance regulator